MKRAKEAASKSRVAGVEADAAAEADTAPAACSSASRVVTIAATMPTGLAAASAVKMAGYLDKRGKRLPTWKQYWFVLDGRLLLYFRSQSEYLHQLSPCRGSLNLGLVSGVKPTGSSRATCPQLVISTRSQAMLLRAKDRATQERWLQALLDALQLNVNTDGRNSGGNHFRYSSASLPQVQTGQQGDKEISVTEYSNEKNASDFCLPKPVLRSGHTSQKDMIKELSVFGKTSLRHIHNDKNNSSPVSKRKNEIVAQLPTSTAVSKLLEKRMEETEEENHVTTIILDNKKEHQDLVVNTVGDTTDIKMQELHDDCKEITKFVIRNKANEIDLDSKLIDKKQEEGKCATIRETNLNPVDNTTRKSSEATTEENTTDKNSKVTREKSFLGRMLERKSKEDGQLTHKTISLPINNTLQDSPLKNENNETEPQKPQVELNGGSNAPDSIIDPYISVDMELNQKTMDEKDDKIKSLEKIKNQETCDIETKSLKNSPSVLNRHTEHISEIQPNPVETKELTTRNISEEKVIVINDFNSKITHVETPSTENNEKNKKEERTVLHKTIININGNETSDTVENCHQIEDSLQIGESLEDNSLQNSRVTEEVLVRNSKSKCNTNKSSVTTLHIYSKNRDSGKYRSVDELDILLHQLTNITFSPLHNCVSMNDLQPLRKSRPGSEPDYDIPRPHNIFVTCSNQGIHDRESTLIHSTSFFGNSENYKSQKRLSEYLLELNRMSQIADKRSSRAVSAQNKWLKLSQQQTSMSSNDGYEVVSEESCSIPSIKSRETTNKNLDFEDAPSQDMSEEVKTENKSQCEETESNSEQHGISNAPPQANAINSSICMISESEDISDSHDMDYLKKSDEEMNTLEDEMHRSNCSDFSENANLESDKNSIQSGIDKNDFLDNNTTQEKSTLEQETNRDLIAEKNKNTIEDIFTGKNIDNTVVVTDENCKSETDFVPLCDINNLLCEIGITTTETGIDTEKCSSITPTVNVMDEYQDVKKISELLNAINIATECAIICNEESLVGDSTLQIEGKRSQEETSTTENETGEKKSFVSEEKSTNEKNLSIAGDVGNEACALREKKSESNAAARLSFAFADSELVLQETVNNLKCEVDAESVLSLTP